MEENTNPTQPVRPQEPKVPEQNVATTTTSPQITLSEQTVQPQVQDPNPAPKQQMQQPEGAQLQKQKKSRKFLLPVVLVGAFLLAGGAAAYQVVFNKSPEQLFQSALSNTSKGFDTFLKIDQSNEGTKINGSFDVSSPLVIDGTISGQWSGGNGSLTSSVGAAGVRVSSDIRTITPENSDVPDIYFKLSGLEGVDGLLRTFGGFEAGEIAGVVQSVNDEWYVVDHTLIEQALVSQQLQGGEALELSEEEIRNISEAISVVMRERFFGTEPDKAVFKINEEIGKEDFEGTGTYKLNVGVDKQNFIAFLESFESVVKDTKLKDVIEMSAPGQSIDELFDFSSISESFENTDFSDANADVWVEGNGRFIRNVRFYPMADKKDSNYLDFLLPYEGGDVIPLVIRATVDDQGAKGGLQFGADINQKNGDSRLWFDIDLATNGTPVEVNAELKFEGTSEQVSVDKPEGARSILELVNQLTGGIEASSPVFPGGGFDANDFDATNFDDFEIPVEAFEL